jgi:peptidoglycan L-alanyl-D-glutamate endopeptidase CwlK
MPKFSAASKARLAQAHPLLQKLFNAVILETDCTVLDAQRGKAAQEAAFAARRSRAHFGQSAHNWSPAVALDVVPYPLDWENTAAFRALAAVVKRKAKELGIPIAWGGDWKTLVDMPHYELSPWRDWAKKSKPYDGRSAPTVLKPPLQPPVTVSAPAAPTVLAQPPLPTTPIFPHSWWQTALTAVIDWLLSLLPR